MWDVFQIHFETVSKSPLIFDLCLNVIGFPLQEQEFRARQFIDTESIIYDRSRKCLSTKSDQEPVSCFFFSNQNRSHSQHSEKIKNQTWKLMFLKPCTKKDMQLRCICSYHNMSINLFWQSKTLIVNQNVNIWTDSSASLYILDDPLRVFAQTFCTSLFEADNR